MALASLCIIVLTGALVRLTGSGLGCVDWPRCNDLKFIDVSSTHTRIEQLNRLFTGVVSFSVIAAVLLAHRRRPRRTDLVALAWCLVAGVLAQIVIGGIVVLTGLNPFANMAHFLVSMLLVGSAFLLWRRSSDVESGQWWRQLSPHERLPVRAFAVAAMVVVVTGTVVTATGPHAGDEDAVRFGFELRDVARFHSAMVLLALSLLLWSAIAARRGHPAHSGSTREAVQTVIIVGAAQGGLGYLQYFTGVPVALVAAHVAGAVAWWLSVCALMAAPASGSAVTIENDAVDSLRA